MSQNSLFIPPELLDQAEIQMQQLGIDTNQLSLETAQLGLQILHTQDHHLQVRKSMGRHLLRELWDARSEYLLELAIQPVEPGSTAKRYCEAFVRAYTAAAHMLIDISDFAQFVPGKVCLRFGGEWLTVRR